MERLTDMRAQRVRRLRCLIVQCDDAIDEARDVMDTIVCASGGPAMLFVMLFVGPFALCLAALRIGHVRLVRGLVRRMLASEGEPDL